MTDTKALVKRLREEAGIRQNEGDNILAALLLDNAARIEAQAAEIERLREALIVVDATIVDKTNPFDRRDCLSEQEQAAILIIRAALGDTQ